MMLLHLNVSSTFPFVEKEWENIFREMNDLNGHVGRVGDRGKCQHSCGSLTQTERCCLGAKAGTVHKEKAVSSECISAT